MLIGRVQVIIMGLFNFNTVVQNNFMAYPAMSGITGTVIDAEVAGEELILLTDSRLVIFNRELTGTQSPAAPGGVCNVLAQNGEGRLFIGTSTGLFYTDDKGATYNVPVGALLSTAGAAHKNMSIFRTNANFIQSTDNGLNYNPVATGITSASIGGSPDAIKYVPEVGAFIICGQIGPGVGAFSYSTDTINWITINFLGSTRFTTCSYFAGRLYFGEEQNGKIWSIAGNFDTTTRRREISSSGGTPGIALYSSGVAFNNLYFASGPTTLAIQKFSEGAFNYLPLGAFNLTGRFILQYDNKIVSSVTSGLAVNLSEG